MAIDLAALNKATKVGVQMAAKKKIHTDNYNYQYNQKKDIKNLWWPDQELDCGPVVKDGYGNAKPAPLFFDRSRHETGLNCKRLRYYIYHEDGTGYTPAGGALPLIFGNSMHQGMGMMLMGNDPTSVIERCAADFVFNVSSLAADWPEYVIREQVWILRCLLYMWWKTQLHKYLNDQWRVITVEKEFTVNIGATTVQMVRLDAIIQRKADGYFFVLEHKTTSGFSADWFAQWDYNLQVILNFNACRQIQGNCGGVIICGLNKGKREKDKTGPDNSETSGKLIQNTVLAYAYRNKTTNHISTVYKPGNGWCKFPVYDSPMSPSEWCDNYLLADMDLPNKLFATTEALAPTDTLIDETLASVILEEVEYRSLLNYAAASKSLTGLTRNFSQCSKFGRPCEYKRYCFASKDEKEAMLKEGDYIVRAPHHASEVELMGEEPQQQPALVQSKIDATGNVSFEVINGT